MPEQGLVIRLDALTDHPGEFTLISPVSHYSVTLQAERSYVLSDLRRRLQATLAGQNNSSEQLTSLALMREIGIWLWRTLLPDHAPTQEREVLLQALHNERTPLLLILPDTVSNLPWELLYDPQATDEQGFLSLRRPLLRFMLDETNVDPITPPLRVLALISSPLSLGEDSQVDVESERAAIEEATREAREAGLLHLLIEDFVTPERVQQHLVKFKPHLLHYIGHGGYDERSGGFLLWEDEQGRELVFTDIRLASLLRGRRLHAVVLHGCKTGNRDAQINVQGTAGTLVREGIAAVLAQQGNFSYESSQRASRVFYHALTSSQSLADALFEVRLALVLSDHPDWAVPLLYGNALCLEPFLETTVPEVVPDPLLASAKVTSDLPTPTGIFVGRHHEMRALRLMLESRPEIGPAMALLLGPGGIGKSTLAAQAITRYGKHYKTTLTLSCLAYNDIGLWLQRIADFLQSRGAPELTETILSNPKLSTEAKIEETVHALNQAGPLLIVIDNLESAQNEDQTICDPHLLLLLQKLLTNLRGGRVLITGRYTIKGFPPQGRFSAHILRLDLDDLSSYEINQLLNRHNVLAQLGEVARATIIKEFGGFPYVYDILSNDAASRDLEQLIFDIQKRITIERKKHSAQKWEEVRKQVVEFATLDVAIDRLSEPARNLLAQLSVLQRPFPLDTIEQGLDAPRTAWQPLLEWSLLRHNSSGQTYHLHSLTKHYAEQLLDEPKRTHVQKLLGIWYENHAAPKSHDLQDYLEAHRLYRAAGERHHAGTLVVNLAEVLRRFGLYPLLRSLCMTTISDLEPQDASLTAECLRQLGMIDESQGNYAQARQLYEQSLQIFEQLGDRMGQAVDYHSLGSLAQEQGDYPQARRLYGQSLQISEQLGNLSNKADTLHNLGMLAKLQGDYVQARQLYEQTLQLDEQLGNLKGKAESWISLAALAQAQGSYAQAHQYYMQSVQIFEQIGDQRHLAHGLHQLGIIAQEQGNYTQAYRFSMHSLQIKEQLGDLHGKANTLGQLGSLAQEQRDYSQAHQLYAQSLQIFEQLGVLSGQAASLHQLGSVTQDQGDYVQAQRFYERSLQIFEQLEDPSGQTRCLHSLGMIAQEQGNYTQAQGFYERSFWISEQLGDLLGKANTLGQLGNLAQEQRDYSQAHQLYAQSLQIFEQLGNLSRQAKCLHNLGRITQERGNYTQARQFHERGLQIFEQLGDLSGQAGSLREMGNVTLEQGNYAQAQGFYARSLQIAERLGNLSDQAVGLHRLGRITQEQGDYTQARQFHERGLQIAEQLGDLSDQATILHQLGSVTQDQGDYVQAQRFYERSLQIFEQLGDLGGQARCLHNLGNLVQAQGNYAQAHQFLQHGLQIFEQLGDLYGKGHSLGQLGLLAYEQGDVENAFTYSIQAFLLSDKLPSPARALTQQLLAQIHQQIGKSSFVAHWQAIVGDHPLPPFMEENTSQQLLRTVAAFMQAPTWYELQQFLTDHPELLQPGIDTLLEQLITHEEDEEIRQSIEEHRLLLQRCREIGMVSAITEQAAKQNPQQTFMATLNELCREVVTVLRAKDTEHMGALASLFEQMTQEDLPLEGAYDFLSLLTTWLRGEEEMQVLMQRAGILQHAFRNAYEQIVIAVEQAEAATHAETATNKEETIPLTLKDLPRVVALLILQGTATQRQHFATSLVEAKHHLSAESAPLNTFLECLVARLHNEQPNINLLEEPFMDLWYELESFIGLNSKEPEEQKEQGND